MSVSITLTLTPLIVLGINFKCVIGALWDYTCTPEITLTLLNCFQVNFQKNYTYTFITMTHKKITEPNFTIFELFSVIPAL